MNHKEFLDDVRNEGYYSDSFKEMYDIFSSFQTKIFKALVAFHNVCEKHQIPYQLAYGSLLGLIRDGGQIPWDYDIDVFVPFYERDRLTKVLQEELGEDYHFQSLEVNDDWRSFIMRMAPRGYSTEFLHVDIFYYIGTPEESTERKLFAKKIQKLAFIHYYKLIKINESRRNWKGILKLILMKLLYLPVSYKKIRRKIYDLCHKYDIGKSSYCISADIFATWYDFPSQFLLETKLIHTEIGSFRVSCHYDELLKLIYGDYKQIPPFEDRIREIKQHYEIFKNL